MVLERSRSLDNKIRRCLHGTLLITFCADIVSDRTGRQHRTRVRLDSRPQLDIFLVESSMFVNFDDVKTSGFLTEKKQRKREKKNMKMQNDKKKLVKDLINALVDRKLTHTQSSAHQSSHHLN